MCADTVLGHWRGLVEQPRSCNAIRCKYHGWSYDWNGQLVNTPSFGEAIPLDTMPLKPHPLRGAEWIDLGPPQF